MIRKTLNVFFPLALGVILFLMAKEAFNAAFPFALPASVILGLAGTLSVLYAVAQIK